MRFLRTFGGASGGVYTGTRPGRQGATRPAVRPGGFINRLRSVGSAIARAVRRTVGIVTRGRGV